MAKGGLGMGLESLMGSAAREAGRDQRTSEIALERITPNPNQPRTSFPEEKIDELARSIKKDGLLQPIIVREQGEGYQIVAGERRYQACKKIGLKRIPARVVEIDDVQAQEYALVENLQRDNLNPIEEAWGYKRLMELGGFKQIEIAEAVSKNPSTISNALRLLDLPDEIQDMMFEGKLSAGHARAILSLPVEEEARRIGLAKKIAEEGLSVRESEKLAKFYEVKGGDDAHVRATRVSSPKSYKKTARKLREFLDAPVKIRNTRGKNKIEVEFKDDDDLERIYRLIASAPAERAEGVKSAMSTADTVLSGKE